MTVKVSAAQKKAYDALYAHAMSLPGAWVDHPWGHTVVKVKAKIFCFLSNGTMADTDCAVGLGVKLPMSSGQVLSLPFAKPTGYGLGKAGWVDIRFHAGDDVPTDILLPWIVESYRAIAPKMLVKSLDTAAPPPTPQKKPTPKKKPAPKNAPKKKPAPRKG